ncbi:MAG: triple tyrosine motif-containing protein [Bacteroidota bacterium]
MLFILLVTFVQGILANANIIRINSYDKNAYNAGRQNWDVDIDEHGVVYFGNSDGLLFNVFGEWGLVTMNEPGPVRAVYTKNDTVWCGGNEYGYFTKIRGDLVYHNLGILNGEMVWDIAAVGNQIYFQSENTIIQYNKSDQSIHSTILNEGIWTIVNWNGKIWVTLRDGQVGYMDSLSFKSVFQTNLFVNHEIRDMFVHNDILYIIMFSGKVFSFNGTDISPVELPGELSEGALFTGMSYDNETFCLGTVTKGFVQLDNNGSIIKWIRTEQGLIDNTVLSMKQDELGNVWLGLDYGIAKVELQSPINPIFEGGATYSVKDIGGKTYLATNKGLFCSEDEEDFSFIEGTGGQTWNIRSIDKELYICHNRGLFKLEQGSFVPRCEFSGFLDFAHFEGTDYYLGSTYQGVILLRKQGNQFISEDNLSIWGNYRLIYDEANTCIWADVYKGSIYKICMNQDRSVKKEEMKGITRVFETGSGIYFSNEKSLLKYNEVGFYVPDHPLLNIVKGENIAALDFSPEGNAVAFIQGGEVKLYVLLPDGIIHSFNTGLRSLNTQIVSVYEFLDLNGNMLRLATDRGVTTFNILYNSRYKKSSQPVISSMTVLNEGHRQWFYPYPMEGIHLSKRNKDLRFRFSINKSEYSVVEYRYRLEPLEKEWSEWNSRYMEAFYPQVKGGRYQLYLQSRINGGLVEDASLSFSVEKQWFQESWMALPYALFFLGWIFGTYFLISRVSERKLKKQKQLYKECESQKTLSLKNEQLLQYIEIISHKNEFLIRLKSGLESMRNKEAMNWANRIADEVDNEKKEFLFHKLFSEIHQDFISRLTNQYPDLTSNDIRILSFIRINLDNKEISNLMNISQRSLDTNRYRLRKKLALDHSTDLNQFIRDF